MELEPDDLDARLKRFYQGQSLDPSKRERLMKQIASGRFGFPRRYMWLAMAAALAVVVGGILLSLNRQSDPGGDPRVAELAAREVALHHRKQFRLDYEGESLEQLAQDMTKLDFHPVLPVRMQDGTRLVGARYCAVLGQIAAQFRFVDAQGRYCTLYQTRCQGDFVKLPEGRFDIDGTHVELWREAGLLMVLALSS